MHSDEQHQSRRVDKLHNQDKVLKESLDLYNGGSLEFLDAELSSTVTDILSTEITETTTKKSFADKVLAEMDRKIQAGEQSQINPLELIYLPLYGSKSGKTTPNLLDTAIKLTTKVVEDKQKQNKLQDLLILLTVSFISDDEFRKVLEANMRVLEDSTAVRVLGEWGENKKGFGRVGREQKNARNCYKYAP